MKIFALFCLFFVAAFLVAAAPPTKEQQAEAKTHFDEAQKQYKLGRFEEAFTEYQRAYELAPFADLLFNMGQCRRNLKDYERALFFFKSYMREAPRAEDRDRVNQLITELEAEHARELAAVRPDLGASRPAETTTSTARSTVTSTAQSARADLAPNLAQPPLEPTIEEEPALYEKWWFWSAIAVVAGAAIGGTIAIVNSGGDPPVGSIGTIIADK